MSEDILTLIGLSRTGPTRAPFWTRSVPVGGFNAISLIEGKAPDRATLIAICRACSFAMADFVPVAPTRMARDELALYTCDQCKALRALIDRVGGRQESILTLEWRDHAGQALPAAREGCDWLHRRVLQLRAGPDRRHELVALAQRLAGPAMALAEARTINAFDGGCDVSLLHSSRDQTALAGKIEAETQALAGPLDAVTAAFSGPFPPYSFVHLPPYRQTEHRNAPP